MGEGQNNFINTENNIGTQSLTAEIKHEQTLFAEPIYYLGDFAVTNSLLVSWAVVAIIIVFSLALRLGIKKIPGKIQGAYEMAIEWFLATFDSITGSRAKSAQFFPLIFAFFIFILLNNWFGLLPGVGTIGQVVVEDGEEALVPYLRGGTADLNTTLALALIAIIASHLFGIFKVGVWKHFNKFINLKALAEIPKKAVREPTVIFVNPIQAFVGLVEIVGELAKIASLSFRLFGNIFAGEVLLGSLAALVAWLVPIPFIFLELIVGVIQALIFSMLTLAFLTINTSAEEH
ncbi:ATP synthase F0 subunit A [Candidatus Falkowbacteria bacterium RIFCSPLOWO2_12_FULL_45_10]|uniref:ATP synthase subunit a n=3 Tax=Candidatus Falkowiibacteriota TaxID=1752728 RepID=A0A1F5S0E2_9BACT|nr:MAG: ATP synthase F0 subunit A [Candidatus Falkowbacteria bacterium RIFCSPLOWO2_12_FULL_45_10]OGF19761.1 MAG: ATP synthase F0 subunit A [Candidatus Falkowbacteria bacterium RIFCSPHIGHO2_02_FULL_45_15]